MLETVAMNTLIQEAMVSLISNRRLNFKDYREDIRLR